MSKKVKKLLLGICTAAGVGVLTSFGTHFFMADLFSGLEKRAYDYRYLFKYVLGNRHSQDAVDPIEGVTVVDIDERAMAKLGLYARWPRSYHGLVAEALSNGGSAAIVFDIMFKTADFGALRTQEVQKILEDKLPEKDWNETVNVLRQGLNYDSVMLSKVEKAEGVIAAAFMNESSAYPNKTDWEHISTEAWHQKLDPSSTADLPESIRNSFPTLPILDNIFPEFAHASDRMGLVNVVPDPDGIHRSIPLLYNFPDPKIDSSATPHTYPVAALQTALYLLGKSLKDAVITPGESIDIGHPLTITRKNGKLSTSYPGLTPPMIEALIEKREELLALSAENPAVVQVSNPIIARKYEDGTLEVEVLEGQFLVPELMEPLTETPIDFEDLAALSADHPLQLSETVTLSPGEDADRYLIVDSETEEEAELDRYTLFVLNQQWPAEEIENLPEGGTHFVSHYLTITYSRYREALTSPMMILTRDVIEHLCATPWSKIENLKEGDALHFGERIAIPIDEEGRMLIHYQGQGGPNKTFRYMSYYDVLANRLDPTTYQGKVFLLGSSAAALFDIVASTFDETYPGVEIHASAIHNILTKNFMHRLERHQSLLILLAVGVAVGCLTYFLPLIWAFLSTLVIGAAFAALSFYAFHNNYWIELVRPEITLFITFLLVVMARYLFEERDKRFLNEAFKNYISPELIDMMVESGSKPSLGGKEAVLTAFFTDIQGFSTFSEKLGSPTKLVELLNEYLSEMTNILLENQGTLDKYEGDAIIAFFGAPVELEDHAFAACTTALAMQEKLAELREKWKGEGDKWPDIVHNMRMRVGINSGPIVTGNMGSKIRMNYTMMGDTVNLAARLESGAKQYGAYTMCSEETVQGLQDKILCRELDLVRVVGKSKPVRIFELLTLKEKATPQMLECLKYFAEGLAFYREQKWELAINQFARGIPLEPYHPDTNPGCKTTPSQVFLERCHQFQTDRRIRLPKDWDGVYTASEK